MRYRLRSSMLRNRVHFLLAESQFVATNDDVGDDAENQDEIAVAYKSFCEKNFPWKSPFEN